MNGTPAILIASQYVASSVTLAYTSPALGLGTLIDYFTVCNNDTSVRTVTVNQASDGAAAANSNRFVAARSLAPGETWLVSTIGSFLPAGGKVYVGTGTANVVSMFMTGRELTS